MNVSLLAGVAAKAINSAIEQINFMRQKLSPAPPLSTAAPFRGLLYCFVRTTTQSHTGAKAEGRIENAEKKQRMSAKWANATSMRHQSHLKACW
jgi:hypothetical protein